MLKDDFNGLFKGVVRSFSNLKDHFLAHQDFFIEELKKVAPEGSYDFEIRPPEPMSVKIVGFYKIKLKLGEVSYYVETTRCVWDFAEGKFKK